MAKKLKQPEKERSKQIKAMKKKLKA